MGQKIRVVIAKPGLDGHERGAKVIARALRDAGMEVIYTGLRQTPEQIVSAALQEDADVPKLNEIGIRGIFQPGTPMQEIVDFITSEALARTSQHAGPR